MKVILVSPSQIEVYGKIKAPDHSHMGLAYIGAVLEKAGHFVQIVDIDADDVSNGQFIKILTDVNPDLVGVTSTTPLFNKAIEITEIVKNYSSAYTVLGGIHPTLMPDETISNKYIDFVIVGEGEETVVELADCLENYKDLTKIRGLIFKKKGHIVRNERRELIKNLDALPFPARHLFKNYRYTNPDALYASQFPILTCRGCPGNCTYCNTKDLHGKKFRYRSAKNVVDEIELLVNKYGAKEVHMDDDNFTTNPKRVFMIRDEIIKRGIKVKFAFPNGLRADFVDYKVLNALKEMGAYSVAFGVESGSQRILDNIKKGVTLKRVKQSFELARKVGLEIWGFFMLGLPGEDETTILETIRFAKKLNPDIAKFHLLKPYPGSEIFNEFLNQGLITDMNYVHYGIHTRPVHRLPNLTEDDLLRWQKKAYKSFYFRPSKIFNLVIRLKSWNRIKLNISTGISLIKEMFFQRLITYLFSLGNILEIFIL